MNDNNTHPMAVSSDSDSDTSLLEQLPIELLLHAIACELQHGLRGTHLVQFACNS